MDDPAAAFPSVRTVRFAGLAAEEGGAAVPYRFVLLVDGDGGWETEMAVAGGEPVRDRGAGGAALAFFRGVLSALPDSGSRSGWRLP